MIDRTLTSIVAKERIGPIANGGESYALRLKPEDIARLSSESGCQITIEDGKYVGEWVFNENSELAKVLRARRAAIKEYGKTAGQYHLIPPGGGIDSSIVAKTLIPDFVWSYFFDSGFGESSKAEQARELDWFWDMVSEGVYNAIEHGTDFCAKGPVRVKMTGGQHGLFASVEQPGTGFELTFTSWEEYEAHMKAAGAGYRNPILDGPFMTGTGIVQFSNRPHALVNTEKENGIFRLIILYQLPA